MGLQPRLRNRRHGHRPLETGTGTHLRDLAGIPPTSKSVHVAAIMIFRVANGKTAETWDVWDALGLFPQIGVVLHPAQASAA